MKKSTFFSEIHSFFVGKRQSQLLFTLTELVDSLKLNSRTLGGKKFHNCKLTNLHIFHILIMMPSFGVQGFSHYSDSVLQKMFSGKKDIFMVEIPQIGAISSIELLTSLSVLFAYVQTTRKVICLQSYTTTKHVTISKKY